MEVPIGNKDNCVATRVGTERENTCNSGLSGYQCAVVARAESPGDANAVCECKECRDEVVRVWDRVNVDCVVFRWGLVGKVNDGGSPGRRGWV